MTTLSVGKAWDETSAFLAHEARLVAPVALALLTIPATIQGWVSPSNAGQETAAPILGLIMLLVTLTGQMAIARLAVGWTGSIGAVIGQAFRRLPVFIASAMIVYVPLILVFLLALGLSVGPEELARLETMQPDEIIRLPGVLWSILLFALAMLALAARFLPSVAVVMSEPVGPLALVKRSWAMTRGYFWRLIGLVLLLGVATLILSGAVGAVVGALAVLIAGPAQPLSLSALLIGLAQGLVTAVVGSVYAAMIGRVYVQLVRQPGVPDVERG